MGLNQYEKRILASLYGRRRWLSTREVASSTKLSWETANKYLSDLYDDGFVFYKKEGKKDLWKFNFEKWSELRKGGT